MPGYNTAHEAVQLREIGLKFHPDVVLVGFLYNDVEPSTAQGRRLGRERHEHEALEVLRPRPRSVAASATASTPASRT